MVNSAVKIEGGGGQQLYLYIVKIKNLPPVLMHRLTGTKILSQAKVHHFQSDSLCHSVTVGKKLMNFLKHLLSEITKQNRDPGAGSSELNF